MPGRASVSALLVLAAASNPSAAGLVRIQDPAKPAAPRFERKVIDAKVRIGYGVAVTDVDGDAKPDIVLVERDKVSWYENPEWTKHVIARKLTKRDHVCIAARDIDGDGRAEIAVGGEWNPGDTAGSGSVHWLEGPSDRTEPWKARQLPHEPTVHRMRFLARSKERHELVVVPLHGRGNRRARGAGVRIEEYVRPAQTGAPWKRVLVDGTLHQTHNVDPVQWDDDAAEELLVAAREGLYVLDRGAAGWIRTPIVEAAAGAPFRGASEVRAGATEAGRFVVSIEPFHGNQVVVYAQRPGAPGWQRRVLDDSLKQGHALACGDLFGIGSDQIVAGWRQRDAKKRVGIKIYLPKHGSFAEHRTVLVDTKTACEDLRLADLDGDGRLDIVAAGRSSRDLVIFYNRVP